MFLEQFDSFRVNYFGLVILKLLQDVHNACDRSQLVGQDVGVAFWFLGLIANCEENSQSVKDYLKSLDIIEVKKHFGVVFDNILFQEQIINCVFIAQVCHVAKNVANLSLDFGCVSLKQLQHLFNQKVVPDELVNLVASSCRYVRKNPTHLPPYLFLLVFKQLSEQPQNTVFEKLLSLKLVSHRNVTQNP